LTLTLSWPLPEVRTFKERKQLSFSNANRGELKLLNAAPGRPRPKQDSLRPLCPSNFNTEHTERLSDLCVAAFPATEGTEAVAFTLV
jgi:hypothetical protein